jgi:hypothetical protein
LKLESSAIGAITPRLKVISKESSLASFVQHQMPKA